MCYDLRVRDADASREAIEAVFRREAPRVLGRLLRLTRDLGGAEDLAQDALVAALETWPESGVPDNPGAWLVTAAARRGLDHLRRRRMLERSHDALAVLAPDEAGATEQGEQASGPLGDDVLRLVYVACHPVLSMDAQVALCLRLVCGLETEAIARAFLVPVPTIAQRLVRARRTLEEARVEFEVPRGEALAGRTAAVLRVAYLVFNEGYASTAGDELVRRDVCDHALHLGRLLVGLLPEEPEAHGLLALMELQGSRTAARIDASGSPVLLLDQDRSRWDQAAITRGLHALIRAHVLGGRGPYVLSAEIAACHARARRAEDTDWPRIVARYDELLALTPTPVVALNRAVALAMVEGPAAGLADLDVLTNEPALARYHRLPAARGDLLEKLGRLDEAREAYERAAEMATHPRERGALTEAAGRCAGRRARAGDELEAEA